LAFVVYHLVLKHFVFFLCHRKWSLEEEAGGEEKDKWLKFK
jgi:hypothetical protein